MGKMKDLALCIDEIMEKIEESLDRYDEISKIYIYNSLSTICMIEAGQLYADKLKKENKND